MRAIFSIFFLLLVLSVSAQRRVVVEFEGLFPFEPLSGYYVAKSLGAVATYIEDWRGYEPQTQLALKGSMGWGYRHYCTVVDTTLYGRVVEYLGAEAALPVDTVFSEVFDFQQSRKYLEHFDSDIQAIKRYFATPLRVLEGGAVEYDPYRNNDYEALFHTFQKEVSGADFSLFSPVSINARLPREVYPRDIVRQLPFDNNLVVVEMTGQQIRDSMEKALVAKYFTVKNSDSDLLRHTLPAFLFQTLSDVKFTVNLRKPRGKRIENWGLVADEKYRVVMNSFLARHCEVVLDFGDYKELFIKWLRESENLQKSTTQYTLQPKFTLEEIENRERKIIFGESKK